MMRREEELVSLKKLIDTEDRIIREIIRKKDEAIIMGKVKISRKEDKSLKKLYEELTENRADMAAYFKGVMGIDTKKLRVGSNNSLIKDSKGSEELIESLYNSN